MSWKKFKITVTRLIEEEACFYVDAPTAEEAEEKASNTAAEIAEAIWLRSDCEPHTFSVVKCENAETPKEFVK